MSISLNPVAPDPIDALLSAHGLRRTGAARRVLGWLLAHPDTSYTHAQLQAALQTDGTCDSGAVASLESAAPQGTATLGLTINTASMALDRVTLYRLIDRLTQVGLLLCRVDANRVRRYQVMPASVHALPHFECQSCHRDQPLQDTLQGNAFDLEVAAQSALQALKALGYQGLSLDLAVRGVCADCATAASAPVEARTPPLDETSLPKGTAPLQGTASVNEAGSVKSTECAESATQGADR